MTLEFKKSKLESIIKESKKVVIAFSGGVDSSYLTKVCFDILGDGALALTIDSPFIPRSEISAAEQVAAEIGIHHQIINQGKLDEVILKNGQNRCYHCKKIIFKKIVDFAKSHQIKQIFDGSNLDDLDDIRPGMKALKELEIESPLVQAEMTKSDIREASKSLNLSTHNKPSMACLASRIPFGQWITPETLKQVEIAENFIIAKGIRQVRVRCHGEIARIEVDPEERHQLFDTQLLDEISNHLKGLGFRYVTFELGGYKTGSLNS